MSASASWEETGVRFLRTLSPQTLPQLCGLLCLCGWATCTVRAVTQLRATATELLVPETRVRNGVHPEVVPDGMAATSHACLP